MIVQLNPRFPLVWRSPTSLQFGIDSPVVQLDDVSTAQERIIAALSAGTTRPGLSVISASAHARGGELEDLLDRLQPVLGVPPAAPSGTVAVIGTTTTAARIRSALTTTGVPIVTPDAAVGLGIMVCHYVVEPELFGFWLNRDIPHLPIVYGDTGVAVGPVIEPGHGPCLYCIERHRMDADPARTAIASQLWGRTSPTEREPVISEVVALALRVFTRRQAQPRSGPATSVFLDAQTGELSSRGWAAHPECGCVALPESGSEPVHPTARGRQQTTTGSVAPVPA